MIIRLVVFLLVATSAWTQPLPKSLLWKITSANGSVSHIFGTIHIQDSAVFRQRDTVLQLIRQCKAYASEMHLDSVATMMQPSMLFLKSSTLYDVLDTGQVRRICAVLNERVPGMGALCSRMKPGAIGMLISFGSMERTADVAMDLFLWSLAKKSRATLIGLESLQEQLAIIDDMTADMLVEHIDQLPREDSLALILPKLYADEDLTGLASLTEDTTEAYSGMIERINDDRNVLMVDRMQPLLRNGGAFIAIGALHLTGSKSILQLLKQRGYRIEAVTGGRRSQWLEGQ
ncbi:MAG: TraB/GumN family protein [Candidatus Kapabacteria bacterium]|nr:TraB/GumN family protein [Candidatus Kapabacteria bacterium]